MGILQKIPPITRSIILINVICYLLQQLFAVRGIDLADVFGLHFVLADHFSVLQLISYMFLHGSFSHLFFNMFSLWMFAGIIEQSLGPKRFLTFYFVCGIGSGLCQELWQLGEYFIEGLDRYDSVNTGSILIPMADYLNRWTTIGASGCCYAVLLAFGMLYPNERIMLLIPPIPMKAKYFVAGYAFLEVFMAWSANDNIAHFAHLGGMLFAWLLLRYWRKQQRSAMGNGGWTNWQPRTSKPSVWQRMKQTLTTGSATTAGNAHHSLTREETDYEFNERRRKEEERMDEILSKVRRSGYDALTREEKEELFRISRNK